MADDPAKFPDESSAPKAGEREGNKDVPGGSAKAESVRPGGAASLLGMTLSGRYKIESLLGVGREAGTVVQASATAIRPRKRNDRCGAAPSGRGT